MTNCQQLQPFYHVASAIGGILKERWNTRLENDIKRKLIAKIYIVVFKSKISLDLQHYIKKFIYYNDI